MNTGEATRMGMSAKNVYGSDYGMSQNALRPSKNGTSKAIFHFNMWVRYRNHESDSCAARDGFFHRQYGLP